MACSSGLEDPDFGTVEENTGGAKPKRSLKFSIGNNATTSRGPSYFSLKPTKEFVASLTAIFNEKVADTQTTSILKRRSPSPSEERLLDPRIGDTFNEGDAIVSRGVQYELQE